MKLLGVTLNYRIDFDLHVSNLCKKAVTQFIVLKRLKTFIGFKGKRFFFRALYILALITVPWYGIFIFQIILEN